MKIDDLRSVRAAGLKAIEAGQLRATSLSMRRFKANYAANCSNPVTVIRYGRPLLMPGEREHVFGKGLRNSMELELEVPCRKCKNCLQRKAAHWRLRILAEAAKASRTWLGTLTLSPDSHFRLVTAARVRLRLEGKDLDTLPEPERFSEVESEAWRQYLRNGKTTSGPIPAYLKRVRKNSGGRLRFFAIAEAHKSGVPHWHLLVHEVNPDQPIRQKHLKGWHLGYCDWRLAKDAKGLLYVAKYVTKTSRARTRASLHYGNQDGNHPDFQCSALGVG